MPFSRFAPIALGTSLALATACATQASARHDAPPAAAARAQRMLDELAGLNGVPGMGAAVWQDGRIVWRGSTGLRDVARGAQVDADTMFRLASVSKLLTVAAAARLAEDGALDVDAPVATQWPGADPAWPALTVRQLAAHTAGVPHYQAQDADRGSRRYASATEAAGLVAGRRLLHEPGSRYAYSSWGYTLISAVIEARSGQHFLDYLRTRIVPGLAIGADASDSGAGRASRAYEFVDGLAVPAPPHDFSYTWAGGGLAATPSALAEFGGRMLAGHVVPSTRWRDMLAPARLLDGSAVSDEDYAVGFGWRTLTDEDGRLRAQHAGVTVGARSALVVWPTPAYGPATSVSLLSNALWVASIEQSAAMLAAPFQPAPPGLVARACPVTAGRYTGTFRGEPIAGTARFWHDDGAGACLGTLSLGGGLAAYFDAFPQRDAPALRVVGLDANSTLGRAALVTPIGLHDLRAQADGSWRARVGRSADLTLRVDARPTRP